MKNKEFIASDYPKACRYCEKGKLAFDRSAVLCVRYGIVSLDHCCRKYVYDPLKRTPATTQPMGQPFSPDDFTL